MPSKKKKYNARFPAGRIKKIMQSDEEIGKVAQAVPVIISRTLELFVESLLTKTLKITNSRNAKTLSTSHMKQCIMSEQRFDFLRELVKNIPDISLADEAANCIEDDAPSSSEEVYPDSDTPYDLSMPSTSNRSGNRNSSGSNNGTGIAVGTGFGDAQHQTHFQYKQRNQQHQNGANETEGKQRLRQRNTANTSVITHTALVNQGGGYVQPLRLMRSDSSPADAAQHLWHVAQPTPQLLPQKRLKHQSQSVPCSSGIVNNNNHNSTCSPHKRQKIDYVNPHTLPQPQPQLAEAQPQPRSHANTQTAIPAPVFSYDLCNKPIVKIDYSNLPLTPATVTTNENASSAGNLPLSAPVTSANFNFNAAPIINIDLSNIVTNMATTTAASKAPPAVATISIGAIPATPQETALFSSNSEPSPSIPTADSKAKLTTDISPKTPTAAVVAVKATTAPATITKNALCKNANSFFELDEDYDNI